jgi:hypothetical protein
MSTLTSGSEKRFFATRDGTRFVPALRARWRNCPMRSGRSVGSAETGLVRPGLQRESPLSTHCGQSSRLYPVAMVTPTKIDRSKSLEQLDGQDWGDPETAETPMISRVLALRRKPLRELTDGELRLAVGQKVGFPIILELAIERLRADPLIEGDYHPGDFLAALVRVDEEVWDGRDDLRAGVAALFRQAMEQSTEEADAFRESLQLPPSAWRSN